MLKAFHFLVLIFCSFDSWQVASKIDPAHFFHLWSSAGGGKLRGSLSRGEWAAKQNTTKQECEAAKQRRKQEREAAKQWAKQEAELDAQWRVGEVKWRYADAAAKDGYIPRWLQEGAHRLADGTRPPKSSEI